MRRVALLGGMLFLLLLPSVAYAETRRPAADAAGNLPFTGLDLILLIVGVCALLAAGLIVRQVSRRLD
jgi:hypothetical protein